MPSKSHSGETGLRQLPDNRARRPPALYALTGRLWVPIGLHLAWNVVQGYVFGTAVSGNGLSGSITVSTARPVRRRG